MSDDRVRVLIETATNALKQFKFAEALENLDEAAKVDPNCAEVYELRGIAFAEIGRGEAAIESVRKATMLAPSAKNFYNLAVLQYEIGDNGLAYDSVRAALELDPKHLSAKKLLRRIGGGKGGDPSFATAQGAVRPPQMSKRTKYGFGKKHLFEVFGEHQREWTNMGWAIVGLAIVASILIKVNFPLVAPKVPDMKNLLAGYKPANTPAAFLTIAYFVTMILASMIWTSVDLIDRRGRALWMVPMMLGCFMFIPFLPQALYMVVGRRDVKPA